LNRNQFWSLVAKSICYNAKELPGFFHVDIRQIERYFIKEFGRTPQDWLDEQRMIAARRLLLETQSPKHVASELGFRQISHFHRHFKRYYGMTPVEYLVLQTRLNPA
jgi:AraC-like DNA-binding protein